jgi:hypothetical protein
MEREQILKLIKETESPLKRQLLTVGFVSKLLKDRGKKVPIIIGGLALSYYTREVFFTADIDLAYSDRDALDLVLKDIGFKKQGRYWVNEDLEIAVEVPVSILAGEDSPLEVVDLGHGLECQVIGLEDLLVDRMNACIHWKSEIDCEMTELLVRRYHEELDWAYLEKKAKLPDNDFFMHLSELKEKTRG